MRSKNKITVLFTSAGSPVMPSLIEAIKDSGALIDRVGGVDARDQAITHQLDFFAPLSFATDPNYFHSLLKVCSENSVDFLIPFSDPETVVLTQAEKRAQLQEIGVHVVAPEFFSVTLCQNKQRLLEHLGALAITRLPSRLIYSFTELQLAAESFGYPKKEVALKPLTGTGSRGFRILSEDFSIYQQTFCQRDQHRINICQLKKMWPEKQQNLQPIMVMPYLSGEDYNIDVLCWQGKVIHCVIQQRLAPKHGAIVEGQIVEDSDIIEYVGQLIAALKLSGIVNVEMARDTPQGQPCIYELNPRPSAALAFSYHAGIPMLHDYIRLTQGQVVPKRLPQSLRIKRYWQQYFTVVF